MRVLFQSTRRIAQNPGGGLSVALNLAQSLRALGVNVAFHDYWRGDSWESDLVHYFSCEENEIWTQIAGHGVPLVVTTISWHDWSRSLLFRRRLGFALRALKHRTRDPRMLGDPFAFPDHFFPNSEGEARCLTRAHGIGREKMTIVPHGVGERFLHGDTRLFSSCFGLTDFVLCVGRFEPPRKNQLSLVRALRSEKIPVVFIGGADPGCGWYLEQCKAQAGPNMFFLPPIKHDDPMLASAYKCARVVVLPALLESPGLVGLEGALAGARVAATTNGSTREYFGNLAFYFDPGDLGEMRRAVLDAYDSPALPELGEHVLEKFSWNKIAAVQKRAYEKILGTG